MYSLAINTKHYDINLLVKKFGKKTRRTIKKTIKKTDILKMMKGIKKTFRHYNMEKLHIPY